MNNDICGHLTNFDDELDCLVATEPKNYINDYQKIDIYNSRINIPAKKIWIKLPKMKVYNNIYIPNKLKGLATISLILFNGEPKVGLVIDFIARLEKKLEEILKDIDDDFLLESSVRKRDLYDTFSLQVFFERRNGIVHFMLPIFNENNVVVNNLDSVGFLEAFIELSEIWIKGLKCGSNWRVLQMKTYPEFDFQKCLFGGGFFQSTTQIQPPQPPSYLPQNLKTQIKQDEEIDLKKGNRQLFVPTVNDLIAGLGNLKKVKILQPITPKIDVIDYPKQDKLNNPTVDEDDLDN